MNTGAKNEELFDVVDDNDQVVDQLPRSEVHARNLRHRAVHVFVFRRDGHMLIHLRSSTKEEFPSVWTSSASGHVSAGESYAAAVPRELFEELGIQPQLTRLHKFEACPATSMEFTELYTAITDEALCVDPEEIEQIEWLPPSIIADRMQTSPEQFSPAFRLLFGWYTGSGVK